MEAQKRKQRQRNRPRNKANNARREQNENAAELPHGRSEVPVILSENQTPTSVVAKQSPPPKTIEPVNVENHNGFGQSDAAPQTVLSPADSEAIKVIQQLLRNKILKQSKDTKDEKQTPTAPAMAPPTLKTMKKPSQPKEQIKSKDKPLQDNDLVKQTFIANLQKKMESVMANRASDLQQTLLNNLSQLIDQEPITDVESSDDDEEYIEYIYKPREYFLVSVCNFCKSDLLTLETLPCARCRLTYYCCTDHMKNDQQHRQLCYGLRQVADSYGGHVFYKCGEFSPEQFRSYRIVSIRKTESLINRPLTATEQEVLLFPRICNDTRCREHRFHKLEDCRRCGQVAYCKDKPNHIQKSHTLWCKIYRLFKQMVIFQEKFGRLEPSLPSKILKDLPGACITTRQILNKLSFEVIDPCEYAALSQVSTAPLTAWYALKLCDQLKKHENLTIHLIGAEIEFEVDVLQKWELFFLHITPAVKQLNIVFIGPELNPRNISFEKLKKAKCCRWCRKNSRSVTYHFENRIYHDYCEEKTFLATHLICFFNAGLYRQTGFQMDDTWPETILAATRLNCPVVVTSYTEYEAPLDMRRFLQETNRRLNVVLPPTRNPFASEKPERNFISDEVAPFMFKNNYCFVVE